MRQSVRVRRESSYSLRASAQSGVSHHTDKIGSTHEKVRWGNIDAETLYAHISCGRRRSSAPSLGRKMEARDSVPSIRGQGDALLRPGTSDTQHHSENAGAAAPQLSSGRNRRAYGLPSGAAAGCILLDTM